MKFGNLLSLMCLKHVSHLDLVLFLELGERLACGIPELGFVV